MKSQYIVDYQEEEKSEKPNIQLILLAMLIIFSGYLYMKVQALERKTAVALIADAEPRTITLAPNNLLPSIQQRVDIATSTPTLQPQNKISPTIIPTIISSITPQPYDLIPAVTNKDHIRGNINAQIVLVEYSDLECPFCQKFHPTMKQVLKEYGDKVAWVYRHYPLPFHENAQKEAEASECAAEQGGNITFWNYIDAILDRTTSNGKGFALEKLVPLAEELGLDGKKFKICLDENSYEQKIKKEIDNAAKGGIKGTPATIIIPVTGKHQEQMRCTYIDIYVR